MTRRKKHRLHPLNGFIQATIDSFILASSSRRFLFLWIIGTLVWVVYNRFNLYAFDDWQNGYPRLVFYYTIWFGLVEGAMKVVQAQQQAKDEKRDQQMFEMAKNTERQTELLLELSRESKKQSEQMHTLIVTSCETINKVLDSLESDGEKM